MTNSHDPAPSAGDASDEFVTLEVPVRAENIALLRRFAGREGASIEELASLWLEEKLGEAMRNSRPSAPAHGSGGDEGE